MESILPQVDALIQQGIAFVYSLAPLVAPTVVLCPPIVTESIATVATAISMDYETTAYVLGLFLAYPLGILMNVVPNGSMKHLFSLFFGVGILQAVLAIQWFHLFFVATVCYAVFIIMPTKVSLYIVPTFAMGYCVLGHLHRQYVNYMGWDLDFTGAMMIFTIKLWMIAHNIHDGHVLKTAKDEKNVPKATMKCKAFSLDTVPNPLQFYGYLFNFSTILAGPAFEYKIYANACDGTIFKTPSGATKTPSNVMPTLYPLLQSIVCMVIYTQVAPMFPFLDPIDSQKNLPTVIAEQAVAKVGFLHHWKYLMMSCGLNRFKYYFAWKSAEGACNAWYAGFEGWVDEKGKTVSKGWRNSCNVDIFICETASNCQMGTKYWNQKTAIWLNRYVYIRTNGSLVATYFISAFWHGFYPGYYMFFLSLPLMTQCERIGRKKITPYFGGDKGGRFSLYGLFTIACTQVMLTYIAIPFMLLSFSWSKTAWTEIYFGGHVVMFSMCVLLQLVPTKRVEGGEDKKKR